MACIRRERTGTCHHHQCKYSSSTSYGYQCVDIARGFCEVGLDCIPECEYSWKKDQEAEAIAAFEAKYPIP